MALEGDCISWCNKPDVSMAELGLWRTKPPSTNQIGFEQHESCLSDSRQLAADCRERSLDFQPAMFAWMFAARKKTVETNENW